MTPKDSAVVPITHKGIRVHQRKKIDTGKKVILCLAPAKPFKGWNILKAACDELWNEGKKIELRVYSPVKNPEPYMVVKENGFTHDDFEKIMGEADVLVAPSICYETFGFTVLEALSYGVPVIVSDHVGAKDIVEDNGIVIQAGDSEQLKEAIKTDFEECNVKVKQWQQFVFDNYKIYGRL